MPRNNQAPADMRHETRLCEELFHSSSGLAFADFITDGHRETWPIRSKRFRTWVRRCYYRATGAVPGAAVLGPALDLLEARAQFDGPGGVVHTRVAEQAGRLYLDLADERWRAVAIGPDAGKCVDRPRSASVDLRVCCRCRCLSAANRLKSFARS
jgi:hypothetical protein